MAQNIYDDPEFLAGFSRLDRQIRGLAGAPEWPTLQSMLPNVADRRVVDFGCGFGWFSRWAHENGATSVLGVDVSTRMLERARSDTAAGSGIEYRCGDLDGIDLGADSYDIAFSSLALHYVHNLDRVLTMTARALAGGGALVFSVEHPIYSAPSRQQFETRQDGRRVWPLDSYLVEGQRVRSWFVDDVVKEHRTVATYLNSVIDAGFSIDRIAEWGPPSAAQVAERPELADDRHRPWFLLVRATRTAPA